MIINEDLMLESDYTIEDMIQEARMPAKERNALPDNVFGLPKQRKFPLNDKEHVLASIRLFNRADKKDQHELAVRILRAMKKFNIPKDKIGKNNKMRNYMGHSIAEGGPGTPVVGISNPPIVDHMMNNAFTSLEMDQKIISSCLIATAKSLLNKEDKYYVPYIPYISESLMIDPNIGFYRDRNGIFVMNENTGLRSMSYENVDDIDDRTVLYVTYGELNDQRIDEL